MAQRNPVISSEFSKAGGGTRTHGRLITNQVLYQLSYSGV
jgi:hypothetical protein